MKKLFLMFALVAFIGANTATNAATSDIVKVECDKCGKECKDGCKKDCDKCGKAGCCKKDAKACSSKGTEGTASATGEAPKSCSKKKSCCKSKAKAEANAATEMKTEEAAPAAK